MNNNYNIVSDYIVEKYKQSISGDGLPERIVGREQFDCVMVGTLAENRVEESFNKQRYDENDSTRFESMPSIGLTFYVDKKSCGKFYIVPGGYVFYTTRPQYEEVVEYFLEKYSRKDHCQYSNITEVINNHRDEKVLLPSVHKKLAIEEFMGAGLEIDAEKLKEGYNHFEDDVSKKLELAMNTIMNEIRIIPDSRISFNDMANEKAFNSSFSIREERVDPHWRFDVTLSVTEKKNEWKCFVQLVNKTLIGSKSVKFGFGYSPRLYNAKLRITGTENIHFSDISLEYFQVTYKKQVSVKSIPENTSSNFDIKNNTIYTDNIPEYKQYRLLTNDDFNDYITFDSLRREPIKNLKKILDSLRADHRRLDDEFKFNKKTIRPSVVKVYEKDLEEYKSEIERFGCGIDQIEYKDFVYKAFLYMNETFDTSFPGVKSKIVGWRLFQIVFIVSLLGEVIRSEYSDDKGLAYADIDVANLLYFPTGGGKTEAFLGVVVFTLFFDRLRGKEVGVSAFIKYPLRLLTVQQLERVTVIMMKANTVLEKYLPASEKFSSGFFVGGQVTPNKMDAEKIRSLQGYSSDYQFIDRCPSCGERSIKVIYDKNHAKTLHVCTNENCQVNELPVYIVDDEIYRFLPSVLVSTVDKLALLGIQPAFKMLLGGIKSYCPIHGYSHKKNCMFSNECKEGGKPITKLKDPLPTLFIQDELHLLKESLGTYASHYESFLRYYAENLVESQFRKKIRIIGATATIASYKDHIDNLYHMHAKRFPCEYPEVTVDKNFYSHLSKWDVTRTIIGYAPYGRSINFGIVDSAIVMRKIVFDTYIKATDVIYILWKNEFSGDAEKLKDILYEYWMELFYNNRKNDVTELNNSFQNQGNNLLEELSIPKFNIEQMTGDSSFQKIREVLFNIQSNKKNLDSTNLILATSTISHGVDEDSFNCMYFYGIPNDNAEYIQAYSRAGRKYSGIVVDIIRLLRVRDRSYLKNFVLFHENKDYMIEPVPINRWAKNAIHSTLPGIIAATILQYFSNILDDNGLMFADKVKKQILAENIKKEKLQEIVCGAYGCNNNERVSGVYKEVIMDEINRFYEAMREDSIAGDTYLSQAIKAYTLAHKAPMSSLRDTEAQVKISLR